MQLTNLSSQFLDKRVKLLDCQKEQMKKLHTGGESIAKLSVRFKVSRRAVYFTLFPEQVEEHKKKRDERGGWKQYYDTTKNTQTTIKHRNRKKEILPPKPRK